MNEQPTSDDVFQNGKRLIWDIPFNDDAGSSKRLRVRAGPSDECGELSTQSWMNQTLSPDSAFLSGPLEQSTDSYSWNLNYFPNDFPHDQSTFPASDAFGMVPAAGAGECSLPGFDMFASGLNGADFLPPVEENWSTFCDSQYEGPSGLEQGQAIGEVEMQIERTPASNWLSEAATQNSVATTPMTFGTPAPDEKLPVPSPVEGSMVESTPVETMDDVVSHPVVECDVCFGAIVVNVVSSSQRQQDDSDTALAVSPCGNILKLSFKSTSKYVGIINSEVLGKLLRDFSVQVTARLQRPEKAVGKSGSKKTKTKPVAAPSRSEMSVRLVVCGLMSEKDAIRDLMSDNELFFQHPLPSEVTGSVSGLQYFNPHLLVRPGSQMPDLASLSVSDGSDVPSAEVLDDVSKARLMRVFDLAGDPTASVEVKPSPRLKKALKSHQLSALAMMAERECGAIDTARFPTLWEKSKRPNGDSCYRHRITRGKEDFPCLHRGGILADEMGLGKTLSALALLCWSLDSRGVASNQSGVESRRQTLVVTPKSTLPGWQDQIGQHIKKGQLKSTVFYGSNRGKQAGKIDACNVVFTTYQTLRSDWSGDRLLYSKPWTRVVPDEAHHIRTRSTNLFKAACALEARFRWCLTGTPIQNSLDDYASLISFIRVEPFAAKLSFDLWIAAPLKRPGRENLRNLENLVKATCLRRTKAQLASRQDSGLSLPPRTEKVEWVDLSPEDRAIYEFFKARTANIASGMGNDAGGSVRTKDRGKNIICLINFLRRICGHGESLLPSEAVKNWRSRQNESIDWQMMQEMNEKQDQCHQCGKERLGTPSEEADDLSENKSTFCICRTMRESGATGVAPSNKVQALVRNLRQELSDDKDPSTKPTKSVVFSCWTKMLDLVQQTLIQEGFAFVRIDGQKSLKDRKDALSTFKNEPECTVMLATIGSAGEGVDFTYATCVHLLEPHWNPMVEAQAVDRVHRNGQHRPVTATRYVTRKSIETIQTSKMKVINQSLSGGLKGEPKEKQEDQHWKRLQEFLHGDSK